MAKLGVRTAYSMEENKRIIARAWVKDPDLTMRQVRYLLAVWKPSGHYEYAKELYEWLKNASWHELRELAGINSEKQARLNSFS